ncbi:MAG TPA: F0F1 ATP synthase subunit A [Patescibacteria group bacterium]|nr:F0F1 ATP synthase subunit A [Patescibacteria group bacterium]
MINSLVSLLASGPTIFISPEPVLKLGGFSITNSIIYGWSCIILITILLVWVARKISIWPKGGIIQLVEIGVSFISDLVEDSFNNKETGTKYVPYFVTLFFFILLNNWLGLIPIVGEGFQSNGHPLLRPFTADLNGTFAMGVITMILVYSASVKESGGFKSYFRHFFVGNPLNPLYLFIGMLEILTDLTRVISLSLRLFLNITIGEILIAVFAYLGHFLAPITALPFTLLEVLVAALQAYIFTILGIMYLAIAANAANEHQEEERLTKEERPATMKLTAKEGSVHG